MGAIDIILEDPIMAYDLYGEDNSKENCREYLDLRFMYDGCEYFIEFKYKLSDIYYKKNKNEKFKVYRFTGGENLKNEFEIKKQGAENNCRFFIYEDIQRMENIKKRQGGNCKSYVIFITNDSAYWRLNGNEKQYSNEQSPQYKDFYLGAQLSSGKDIKNRPEYTNNKDKLIYKDKDKDKLNINNKYLLQWFDFKTVGYETVDNKIVDKSEEIENSEFKALIIDLQKTDKNFK